MNTLQPGATFRDPAGSLHMEEHFAVRTIDPDSRHEVLELLDVAFCGRAQERGDLIAAEAVHRPDGLRLLHPRIAVPAYPWEWTPAQWLAAANLTLALCEEALSEGWILKDATPLNVLFVGTRPIFVDILSFERRNPHSSIWLAYGQYIRTFLLPLVMHRLLGWPLSLSLLRRDGLEPAECYAALGWRQRLSRLALWPITLPTLLERRDTRRGARANSQKSTRASGASKQDPELTAAILKRMLATLRRSTARAASGTVASDWSKYTATLTHYTQEESRDKQAWVHRVLEQAQPKHVLDIGANTGEFSGLAASLGAEVVALERDQPAADRLYGMARERKLPILVLNADIARPSPAVGWLNAESQSLLARLEGRFDVVLMLAVIHHLILMEQVPVPAILALCHSLTTRLLVLEWVPPSDPMYQSLMRGRDALYCHLNEQDLLAAADGLFRTLDRHPLANGRVLFLFEKLDTIS